MSLRRSVSALLGIMFLSIGVITPLASAQQGGNGLQLSPTRSEISANPGESKTVTLTLKNITQADFTAKAVLNDFESDNISGTPKILVNDKDRTPYSVSSMLKGLSDVQLKAGEVKEVKLTLDVPGNASPGAYFGAVRFSVIPQANASDSDRQIALNASVAHLVFVEVPGNVTEQIKVENLKFLSNKKAKSVFITKKPDTAALSVRNLGNGFSRPFGKVSIEGPFGKTAHSYEVNANDPRSIVLPNSARTFEQGEIKGIKLPGKYSSVASVAYGNGGEVVNYKANFWYLPIWFLILLVILIGALIGGGYYVYRKFFGSTAVKKPAGKKAKR